MPIPLVRISEMQRIELNYGRGRLPV
ncbi:MAG: hypothetical protein K0S35_3148, partial [Geminicoccaceae bacterium]|nr:hypothetical protein [Geminicoccaceae bacterium]